MTEIIRETKHPSQSPAPYLLCPLFKGFNTGQIRFLLEIKNSNTLKVGVCALARSHHDE